jgi:small-conductance mechanosensitive channel
VSKELETIDTYIEQQQSQIAELMQTVMLLQTKVKMLESENKRLKDINRKNLDESGEIIVRKGVRLSSKRINSERRDPVPEKTVIQGGFTTRKGTPAE